METIYKLSEWAFNMTDERVSFSTLQTSERALLKIYLLKPEAERASFYANTEQGQQLQADQHRKPRIYAVKIRQNTKTRRYMHLLDARHRGIDGIKWNQMTLGANICRAGHPYLWKRNLPRGTRSNGTIMVGGCITRLTARLVWKKSKHVVQRFKKKCNPKGTGWH